MDLDYRTLSNAGFWAIGRLQRDADRERELVHAIHRASRRTHTTLRSSIITEARTCSHVHAFRLIQLCPQGVEPCVAFPHDRPGWSSGGVRAPGSSGIPECQRGLLKGRDPSPLSLVIQGTRFAGDLTAERQDTTHSDISSDAFAQVTARFVENISPLPHG